MKGLNVGGFKSNNENQPPLFDLAVEPSTVEPVNLEPAQPAETLNLEPTTVEPILNEPTEPANPEPVVTDNSSLKPTEPTPVVQPELNDEKALKYLSEKLGRDFKSLDEISGTGSNPLEEDPYLKGLYEWRQKTGRPIEDFIKYQKDYNSLGDLDVAREFLQYEYPTLTPDEINLELSRYQASEDDLDTEASFKSLELKKLATKGRQVLDSMRAEFGEPTSNLQTSPEVKEALELAKQVKQQEVEMESQRRVYLQSISNSAQTTDKIELNLDDNLSIDYKMTDEAKRELPSAITEMAHWKNPDGTMNHDAIVKDGIKIQHFDSIVKLAYQQGVNAGKEELSKKANNITLDTRSYQSQGADGKKGVTIDGLDGFLGNKGMKINAFKK